MPDELTAARLIELRDWVDCRLDGLCQCEMADGEECDECRPWQTLCVLIREMGDLTTRHAALVTLVGEMGDLTTRHAALVTLVGDWLANGLQAQLASIVPRDAIEGGRSAETRNPQPGT